MLKGVLTAAVAVTLVVFAMVVANPQATAQNTQFKINQGDSPGAWCKRQVACTIKLKTQTKKTGDYGKLEWRYQPSMGQSGMARKPSASRLKAKKPQRRGVDWLPGVGGIKGESDDDRKKKARPVRRP